MSGQTLGRLAALAAVLLVVSCSREDPPLPGLREDIRPEDRSLIPLSEREEPIAAPALTLPTAERNGAWTHINRDATHLAGHVALAERPQRAWSVGIGRGDARRARLTSGPVVAGGTVYVMDSAAQVSAVSTAGRLLWQVDLTPDGEGSGEGFGGGVSVAQGAVVATTGFGEVLRLDAGTGEIQWRQTLEGAVRAAPTIADDRVVAVSRGDIAYGLDLETGRIEWRVQGTGLGAGIVGGASAAVRGPVTIIGFQSGEISAVLTRNGLTVWNAAVTGGRRELVRSSIKDITGTPVIDFDIVYAANQAGRLVALDRRSGERIWTHRNGALSPAIPAGGSVFLVSDAPQVLRLVADTGEVVWTQDLPQYERPRRRRGVITHYGPILAGGRLYVVSSDRQMRVYDPATGAEVDQIALPGQAAAQPAVANGVLYLLTQNGQLHAFQ